MQPNHHWWLNGLKRLKSYTNAYTATDHVECRTDSYNDVDEARDEIIADNKNDGYSIKYINLSFNCED
jgi:hypothetical protein